MYEKLFPDRFKTMLIMEIGVAHGASLRAWKEHFPHSYIVGVDREPDVYKHQEDRIECHQIEQTDFWGLWERAVAGRAFDWIIEDAEHTNVKQILTMTRLWQALKPGGYYCVEDVLGEAHHRFNSPECFQIFRGEFYNLNSADFTDGGQLFVHRRAE